MSFAKKSTQSKNQFVARLISKKTSKTASFINLTDEFSRQVFGMDLKEVTAEMVTPKLKLIFENEFLEVAITDLTAEIPVIDAKDY